jgi:hypothetical protein
MDWHAWHRDYDGDTPLSRRLATVQAAIRSAIASSTQGSYRVLSMCAGDGRDIFGALEEHPGAARVTGRLVELDRDLATAARDRAAALGLDFEVVTADAGSTHAYSGSVPADLVLACGVFGNISDVDVERTIRTLPMLVADGGVVIWTRTRRAPDLTPQVRSWFLDAGFAELSFTSVPDSLASVGVHKLVGSLIPFEPGRRLFTFIRTE